MTKMTLNRAGRITVFVAAVLLACQAVPAGAAPNASSGRMWAWGSTYETCEAGATCTGAFTAARDGVQVVSASVSRPAATEIDERYLAWGAGSVSTRAPAGTEPLRVTFTWRVDSASTSADSTTIGGIANGSLYVQGWVYGCSSCVVEDDGLVAVAGTLSFFGPAQPDQTAAPGSTVSSTITVNREDGTPLPAGTRFNLAGRTLAFAYVGGLCDGECATDPQSGDAICDGECATHPHSGTAKAEGKLQLISIAMVRGADDPVLLDL